MFEVRVANRPDVEAVPTWNGREWVAEVPSHRAARMHTAPSLRVVMGEWRSPDYVPGEAGWAFKPDGSLEANNITARGTIKTGVSPSPRIELNDSYLAGYSDATTKQFYLSTVDGKAYAGGGAVKLDENGVTIAAGTGENNQIKFVSGGTTVADYHATLVSHVGFSAWQAYNDLAGAMAMYLYIDSSNQGRMDLGSSSGTFLGAFIHGDTRIGGGLYVGSTSTDPDSDDIYYEGDLRPVRGGTSYTGTVLVDNGLSVLGSDVTLTTTYQDIVSTTITVPTGGGYLIVNAHAGWEVTSYSATYAVLFKLSIDGTKRALGWEQMRQAWDRGAIPLSVVYPVSAGSIVVKIMGKKEAAYNTALAKADRTQISWALFV